MSGLAQAALDPALLVRRGQYLRLREDTMKVIIYGDFNCPYPYLAAQVIPAVIGPDQIVRSGFDGLRYLVGLADAASAPPPRPAARAEAAPNTSREPVTAAAA